jgi:hypothetical protein
MKQYFVAIIILLIFLPGIILSQAKSEYAFSPGEKLVYRVFYSSAIIDATAGEAVLTITETDSIDPASGDSVAMYKILGTGSSKGLFDLFFTVRDTFESYIDKKSLLPYYFVRKTYEGNYVRKDFVAFNRDSLIAKTSRKVIDIPQNVFDLMSAFYYMRQIDVDDYGDDSMYLVNFYLDDSVYYSAIKFVGRDTLKTKQGLIPTLKIAPMMATGEVFAKKYPMYLWVSDDKNHIPVLASSEVIVGSVKMELKSYKNLKYPFVKQPKKKKRKKQHN